MRVLLRRVGTALLFLVTALCFAPTLIPPLLDRIYYRGPDSAHFDGRRFFNPGPQGAARHGGPARYVNRLISADDRHRWPSQVAVRPTVPPRRVEGEDMVVTWIGHATALVQSQGLNILTDPIWSRTASPFPPIGPDRVRDPGVRFEDLPRIDLILVSHNHYDHLDLPTLKRLWERDRPLIVTSLGNDAILLRAGIESAAFDWGKGTDIPCRWSPPPGIQYRAAPRPCGVIVERVQHWSSRWASDRNRALWSGFTVRLPGGNLFFAGDTGWGDGSWADEAARRGPIRLALLPIGAYAPRDVMKPNHVDPAEALDVFERLNPAMALGIHWGTFRLTDEGRDAPPVALAMELDLAGIPAERFVAAEPGGVYDFAR